MRDTNLVNALRCALTAGGPIYKTEPVPKNLKKTVNLTEWSSCDVDAVGLAAADRIEACLKCGNYTLAHEGACNGCRWRR